MNLGLKIFLIIVSFGTFAYIIRKIRKSQTQITDMSFWVLFSLVLILMAIFPDAVGFFAQLIGVSSIIHFVFLSVIFLLLAELFLVCIKLSKLESKVIDLAGELAIQNENKKKQMKEQNQDENCSNCTDEA